MAKRKGKGLRTKDVPRGKGKRKVIKGKGKHRSEGEMGKLHEPPMTHRDAPSQNKADAALHKLMKGKDR